MAESPQDTAGKTALMLAFIVLDLAVIIGNSLVVTAVFTHVKLRRSTTNKFVVSLAFADLMVGIVVLPFSSVKQVLSYWPFGYSWCRIWLAVDVWLCTASILNLCAISLDRYLAISRPFRYLSLMSPYRARLLVVAVWILSFIICLPPLIRQPDQVDNYVNSTSTFLRNGSTMTTYADNASETCELNSGAAYTIYSACGSFWIPMIIMVVFYWRIYRTANMATAAIRRGFIASCDDGNGSGGSRGTPRQSQSAGADPRRVDSPSTGMSGGLRVHRGGGCLAAARNQSPSICSLSTRPSNASLIGDVVDYTHRSSTSVNRTPRRQIILASDHQQLPACRRSREQNIRPAMSEHDLPQIVVTSPLAVTRAADAVAGGECTTPTRSTRLRNMSGSLSQLHQMEAKRASPFSRLNQQLRSLNREKKAAKTVGVIVGFFIVCWAPFFSVYLLNPFFPGRTPETLFDVFFWLGYCNSVANPIIYGLCSRDFRYAFAKLLRCRCERRPPPPPPLSSVSTLRRHNSRLGTVLRSFRLQIATENSPDVADSYS